MLNAKLYGKMGLGNGPARCCEREPMSQFSPTLLRFGRIPLRQALIIG